MEKDGHEKRRKAGRPRLPAEDKAVAITVRVRPVVAFEFVSWCADRKISQSKAFTELAKTLK